MFQSTHPRGVRLTGTRESAARLLFQSTHPRGVRPSPNAFGHMTLSCFNPRTRVGCDPHLRCRAGSDDVSIHAPAWGATPGGLSIFGTRSCFNPRTRVGCDPVALKPPGLMPRFQSTHPRGVRRQPMWITTGACACFNPRTRVGCDLGASSGIASIKRFNPRTRVGCDGLGADGKARSPVVSIHAPAWGATRTVTDTPRLTNVFQSTHPRGVRLAVDGFAGFGVHVSIHAPAWGATAMACL